MLSRLASQLTARIRYLRRVSLFLHGAATFFSQSVLMLHTILQI